MHLLGPIDYSERGAWWLIRIYHFELPKIEIFKLCPKVVETKLGILLSARQQKSKIETRNPTYKANSNQTTAAAALDMIHESCGFAFLLISALLNPW